MDASTIGHKMSQLNITQVTHYSSQTIGELCCARFYDLRWGIVVDIAEVTWDLWRPLRVQEQACLCELLVKVQGS